jgi:hypothetical protein
VAAGLAVLLAVLVAGVVGRVTAPSTSAQPAENAPSQADPSQLVDPSSPGGQGPSSSFTPRPGSAPTFYSGHGNTVVPITKDAGPAIVEFVCATCTGAVIVKSDGPESVLVNAVGSYSGRRPIDLREGSNTTTMTVTATADWRMTVSSGLNTARASVGDAPLTGQGDDVVIMNGTAPTAHVTNSGGPTFIVYVVPVKSATVNLAVNNPIGEYDGVLSLTAPAVVIVQSTGAWTITPRT